MSDATERRAIPPVLHALAICLVFAGFLVYPFTGSRGTNLLAVLILLAYAGSRGVLRAPLLRLQRWLAPRGRTQSVLLAVAAMVCFAGSIEAAGQIVLRAGWVETYSAIKTQLPHGVGDFRHFHVTADKYREADPLLLWRPVDRWPYNAQRMKGPLAEIPKPERLFRIMAFGDSNTDGPHEHAWPERLQEQLAMGGIPDVQVLNAGVAGYSSHQGLLRFRATADFDPDLVLVSFGWNDAAPAVAGADKDYQPPARWLIATERFVLHYRSYRALKMLQQPERPETPDESAFPPRVSVADYRANLQAFLDEARDRAVVPVFLTRPHAASRQAMELAATDMRRLVPSYNDALRAFAADADALLIDVQQRFSVELRPGVATLFSDDSHFNELGSQAMAELLAARLTDLGLVPGSDRAGQPRHDAA